MDLTSGILLNGRYRIDHKLGQGGMGAVYLAVDTVLDAQVAVKANHSPAPESTTQFLREARLLAALRHPNLPRVTDYFVLDGTQYLVMDYIAGKDLETLLTEQGALPLALVLDWARQLGDALVYLHQRVPPVIHRDIKPANVRLSAEGQAVLVDFGIAKVLEGQQSSSATATGALGYTPGYAPPEQYGGSMRTGPYTDQYAFAALIYHLLSEQKPTDSVQRALGQASLPSVHLLRPDVPVAIADALDKALALKPEARFASMEDLLRALGTLPAASDAAAVPTKDTTIQFAHEPANPGAPTVSGPRPSAAQNLPTVPETEPDSQPLGAVVNTSRPATAVPPVNAAPLVNTAPPATAAPRRGPNWALIAGLVVLVMLLAGAALIGGGALLVNRLVINNRLPPSAGGLVITPHTVTPPAALAAVRSDTPMPQATPTLPDATTPVPPVAADTASPTPPASDTPQPSDTPVPSLTPIPLGQSGRAVFASDRADGQTLQLWLMNLSLTDSGQVNATDFQQLTNSPGDKRWPVWSPDGQRLLYVAPGDPGMGLDLWIMDADGSSEPVNITRRAGDDTEPAWSPDGNWIAFTNNGREDKVRMIYLIHPDGSGLKRLSTDQEEFGPTWSPDMQRLGFVMNVGSTTILFIRDRNGRIATPVHDFFVTPQRFDMLEVLGNLGPVLQPSWSPDGNRVAYTRQDGSRQRIYLARYPVKNPSQDIIQLTDGSNDTHPNWSPDGQWLLFNSDLKGNAEIIVMRATGQLQTNLTNNPSRDLDAAWQP